MHCCGYYTIILIVLMEKFVNASQWYIIRAEVHDIVSAVYVTGFGKTCIVHTSNFSNLVTHNISLEGQIDVKLLGIVEPILLYHP